MSDEIYVLIEHIHGSLLDISRLLLSAAHELAEPSDGQVTAIVIGSDDTDLIGEIVADKLLVFDREDLKDFLPDNYVRVLADLIEKAPPRLMIMGETSIGADLAGRLSAKAGLPIIGNCRKLEGGLDKPSYTSAICGGKILVSGPLPDETSLVCMIPGEYQVDDLGEAGEMVVEKPDIPSLEDSPIRLREYLEPEVGAVDITREPVLVAVGRGIQREDNLELAQELAGLMHAQICASRPVVDQGWIPTSQMVGKSGKVVKPNLYLALGISGAPEHVEGMSESDLIVAVNTDPGAPIFDVADYGVEMDLLDLLPEMIERIQAA
ncbi:MAG: electron transfer flavoprotein subunit alpha/FixB family protein [Anaerolineales bacterium]|jgi:electron transfer flavoprotein alpha subunit